MDKHRLDKWLWAARFFKTRALAAEEIGKGRVKVNGQVAKPSREVHEGDLIELRQAGSSRTVVVTGAERHARPGAGGAGALRGDRRKHRARDWRARPSASSSPEPALAIEQGRPTKRDRRQLADWNRWSASADPD